MRKDNEFLMLEDEIIKVLKQKSDPEIPVNIYDLGLIYDVKVSDTGKVTVTMTLTSPHCPAVQSLPREVEEKAIKEVEEVTERPAETENETVKLLKDAKARGVQPHILDVKCEDYEALFDEKGEMDFLKMLPKSNLVMIMSRFISLTLPQCIVLSPITVNHVA